MTEGHFWWSWWVQVVAAVGTVGAVLVALFGEVVRAKLFPPELRLHLLRPEGELTPVDIESKDDLGYLQKRRTDARYYHLQVTNERRWSPAHQVQVFLTMVESPEADGRMQAVWAGGVPMRWRHQEVFPLSRPVGAAADVDFLSAIEKWVEIMTLIKPFNLETRYREECHFILTFQARASQADSPLFRIRVDWDGQWDKGETEMMRHLILNVL